jgi:hypothetical protein
MQRAKQRHAFRLAPREYRTIGGARDGEIVTLQHCVEGHPYCPRWHHDDDSWIVDDHPDGGCLVRCSEPGCQNVHCPGCGYTARIVGRRVAL